MNDMTERLKGAFEEIEEERRTNGQKYLDKFYKFCEEHPWTLPSIRIGLLAGCGLMTGAYLIGRRHGVKAGRVEYICDPDILVNANAIFNKAAEILDLADEIETISEVKVTKF